MSTLGEEHVAVLIFSVHLKHIFVLFHLLTQIHITVGALVRRIFFLHFFSCPKCTIGITNLLLMWDKFIMWVDDKPIDDGYIFCWYMKFMYDTYILDVLLRSITEYFYELCRIMTSPLGKSKYKQRVKFSAILHNQTSHKRLSNMPKC